MELAWALAAALGTLVALVAAFFVLDAAPAADAASSGPAQARPAPSSASEGIEEGIEEEEEDADAGIARAPEPEPVAVDARKEAEEADTMASDDDDDLLDAALDEMDLLDEVAEDLLLEAAAEEDDDDDAGAGAGAASTPASQPQQQQQLQQHVMSGPPRTWQETLQILEPAERVEWAKTISKDLSAQANMAPQPNYSSAYNSGTASGKGSASGAGENGGGENAVASLMSGNVVITPDSPATLFAACLKKALLAVNKEYVGDYTPSAAVLEHFRSQLATDILDRLEHHPVEREDVLADPERFVELSSLLESS